LYQSFQPNVVSTELINQSYTTLPSNHSTLHKTLVHAISYSCGIDGHPLADTDLVLKAFAI